MTQPRVIIAALQIAGLAVGLGAAGCATAPANETALSRTNLDMHPVKVHQDTARLEIGVAAADQTLRSEDYAALSTFARDYKDRGRGPLMMSVPAGASNAESAAKVGDEIRRALYGLMPVSGSVSTSTYDAGSAAAPIILSFERYVADVKDCPSNAVANLGTSWDNKASAGFGCANNMNIAMMLADPGDVVAPPDMDPSLAARRTDVFDKYRKGQPTATARSDDERGAVSSAVK
jgi:pilus assembly protein CpaD